MLLIRVQSLSGLAEYTSIQSFININFPYYLLSRYLTYSNKFSAKQLVERFTLSKINFKKCILCSEIFF